MEDKCSLIFGNPMPKKVIKKAEKNKKKYLKKYGDDTNKEYHLSLAEIPSLSHLGVSNLVLSDTPLVMPKNPLIVGNIRMGFGHYRISIAMASCAKALGYDPLWLDLASFDATGSKVIREQNDLYSLASKISQKSRLFNHFFWEPLNCEGFRKITYNVGDQKNSELLVPLFRDIPKDTPYIATHVWPSQAAVHAEMTHVVNAIPDNWPMGLHLSEGAIHTVQTSYAYLGYKMLNGFDKKPLKGMPDGSLFEVGHYVDHELVAALEADSEARLKRRANDEPFRVLLTVGGAGAGAKQFLAMLEHFLPLVKQKKVALFLNFGDHLAMYDYLKKKLGKEIEGANEYFDKYDEFVSFVSKMNESHLEGLYFIENSNIFEAVYSTNLLMHGCDLLITKPSELVFYPIPKIFQRHIGGHEVYGAIHGREMGDATFECEDPKSINTMFDTLLNDKGLYAHMVETILKRKAEGLYNGGYEAVKLAAQGSNL